MGVAGQLGRIRFVEKIAVAWLLFLQVAANRKTPFSTEAQLVSDVLRDYNTKIIPRQNNQATIVKIGMTLLQIISVDAKSEVLTTSVYMTYSWRDLRLTWEPSSYDGINVTRIAVDNIWSPKIILENSQIRHMQESLRVNALVWFDGLIEWLPPAIYRSSCSMSMAMFPFDWQNCSLLFRSSDYDQSQMTFDYVYTNEIVVDDNAFVPNGEWDLLQKPITILPQNSDERFQKVSINVIIKRKPQFYIMNLVLPCVMLSLLACFVFYLPVVAGEKISLAISLLLGYTVFIFLLAQVMPSTSLAVPLFASYILFTMTLLSFCILCCVFVYNFHFRSDTTHKMPRRLRKVVFNVIGPLLGLDQPDLKWTSTNSKKRADNGVNKKVNIHGYISDKTAGSILYENQAQRLGFQPRFGQSRDRLADLTAVPASVKHAPHHLRPTLNFIQYVTGHVKFDREKEIATDEWAYLAFVLDRLLFWVYLAMTYVGLIGYYFRIVTAKYPEKTG